MDISTTEMTAAAAAAVDIKKECSSSSETEVKEESGELLGSVTTYNHIEGSDNCQQQIRSSARVYKKMKLDSSVAAVAASSSSTSSASLSASSLSSPSMAAAASSAAAASASAAAVAAGSVVAVAADKERKDIVGKDATVKADAKKQPPRPAWTAEDKNLFFEALNEFGKDFESIQNYVTSKVKKKGLSEAPKTREQVRLFYNRTFHKISKYLKFSDDIKKNAQELYALINYGELRRKLGIVSEKACMKLNEMIFRGAVQVRVKGKTVRIRTPMCKALRRLNEIDDKHYELKLPTRVTVELTPKNNESWSYVQSMAQNPRVKIVLPLQRRLIALMQYFNDRWKTDDAINLSNATTAAANLNLDPPLFPQLTPPTIPSPSLHFAPKPNVAVEIPNIALSEYLTSTSICLNSFEERHGIYPTSEELYLSAINFKGGAKYRNKSASKRNSRVGEAMPAGEAVSVLKKEDCSLGSSSAETNEGGEGVAEVVDASAAEAEGGEMKVEAMEKTAAREEIAKVRNGWKMDDCGILSIGDLYLMFGSDGKLQLDYWWDFLHDSADNQQSSQLTWVLQRLLSLARLQYRKARIHCPCGHVCGDNRKEAKSSGRGKVVATPRFANNTTSTTNHSSDSNQNGNNNAAGISDNNSTVQPAVAKDVVGKSVFRRPILPYPNKVNNSPELFRAQLERICPRYCNRRGRPIRSKQVVVQRMLPLLPKPLLNGHSIVTMKVIPQPSLSGEFVPLSLSPKETHEEENESDESDEEDREETEAEIKSTTANNNNNLPLLGGNGGEAEVGAEVGAEQPTNNDDDAANKTAAINVSRVNSPTSISNYLEMAIQQNADYFNARMDDSSLGVWADTLPGATPISSPSHLLRDDDQHWLNAEVADFSLSSLLGHLESPVKNNHAATTKTSAANPTTTNNNAIIAVAEETRMSSQDVDAQFHSLMIESSVDYTAKFADLAAKMAAENSTTNAD